MNLNNQIWPIRPRGRLFFTLRMNFIQKQHVWCYLLHRKFKNVPLCQNALGVTRRPLWSLLQHATSRAYSGACLHASLKWSAVNTLLMRWTLTSLLEPDRVWCERRCNGKYLRGNKKKQKNKSGRLWLYEQSGTFTSGSSKFTEKITMSQWHRCYPSC